jgi:hypothetical protein
MSAVAKIAIGVVCFFGFTLAALLFFYAVNPWIEQAEIPVFRSRVYDAGLFGVTGLLCLFVTIRLIQGRTWAWWSTFAVSLLTLGLGSFVFISALHPRDDFARSESGFGLGIAVFLMTPGAISGVLLPSVRRTYVMREGRRPAVKSGNVS